MPGKCDRPFTMMRVEMDGSVYMCPKEQKVSLNAFEADPVEIWNSADYRRLRYQIENEEYDDICMNCHMLKNRLILDAETEKANRNIAQYRIENDRIVGADERPLETSAQIVGCVDRAEHVEGQIKVSGWAADLSTGKPCKLAIVFAGGHVLGVVALIVRRPDVAAHFAKPRMTLSGFELLADDVPLADAASLRVFAIDGQGRAGEIPFSPSLQRKVATRPIAREVLSRALVKLLALAGGQRQQSQAMP